MEALPPVLLTSLHNCGTLAAARCLGRLGYPIWLAGDAKRAPVLRSKYVQRHLDCPSIDDEKALIEWLVEFGRKEPGAVLYPTSDDFAWLQARHADVLAPYYRLYAPKVEVLDALLDKHALHALCVKAGLKTPPSASPETEAELEAAAATIPLPVLIKQRTQLFSKSRDKGVLVTERDEVLPAAKKYWQQSVRADEVHQLLPWASLPVLQTYFAEGTDQSLQVSGFIDESGELFVTRGCLKVLQRPRRMGISLCLEDVPVPPELHEGIRRLCREAGYFGVFEVEFLHVRGEHLLIDFNPRYYHYLAFCIARGMPLPLLTMLGATDQHERLVDAVHQAQRAQGTGPKAFVYRYQLEEMLLTQGLAGRMSPRDVAHWVQWYRRHAGSLVDAVDAPDDRAPHLADVAQSLAHIARHPRSFLRQIVFAT